MIIILCISLLLFRNYKKSLNNLKEFELFNDLKEFEFYDINNKKHKNTNWSLEVEEQLALQKYLQKNDYILQLGGNIGLSCIMADKILNNKKNICVEPHPKVIPILKKNKILNNSKFQIIKGAITKKKKFKNKR